MKTEGWTLTGKDGLKRFGINGYNRIQCRHLLLFPNIDIIIRAICSGRDENRQFDSNRIKIST